MKKIAANRNYKLMKKVGSPHGPPKDPALNKIYNDLLAEGWSWSEAFGKAMYFEKHAPVLDTDTGQNKKTFYRIKINLEEESDITTLDGDTQ